MTNPVKTFNINAQPGIFRDWTLNSSPGWTDGQHTRFFEGRPKKIGGVYQIGELGLSPNNTPFSATGHQPLTSDEILAVGDIRKIYSYPVDNKYIVIVAADLTNNFTDLANTIDPNEVLYPSGLFIGISSDNFVGPIKFYPIRFEQYLVQNGAMQVPATFVPSQYAWCVSVYGVSSGGPQVIPQLNSTAADSALTSLALVAYASPSLQDKTSTQDNYVFFALLSDILDFNSQQNYVLDPCLEDFPDSTDWVAQTLPLTQAWTSGAYGDGVYIFVASGDVEEFVSSTNGEDWAPHTIPVLGNYYTATFSNGLFIAPQNDSNICLISYDGMNWGQQTMTASSEWDMSAFGNGVFVVIAGATGLVQISSNGINWAATTPLDPANTYGAMAFGEGLFVVVSNNSNIAYVSSNTNAWQLVDLPQTGDWNGIAYGNGVFFAISNSGDGAYSEDGLNWELVILPSDITCSSIAFGGGAFAIVASDSATVFTSLDGLIWKSNQMLPASSGWIDVIYGDGQFVAIATGADMVADSPAKSENVKYVYSPIMYPITQNPIGGLNGYNPNNPFSFPTPLDPQAIYATSEIYVSGGVETVGPFLVAYSNNGLIRNSSSNSPGVWFNNGNVFYNQQPLLANDNNVDNYKVIKVGTMRTGADLSFVILTTNTVTTASFCGAPGVFRYATNTFSCSIISAASVIEHNNIFYWVGEIAFFQFDGNALSEMPNAVNKNWFFDNITNTDRAKTWSFKNPRFNEIWFVAPMFGSTEPNHAIIYNYVLNTWYDTPWNFSAGYFNMAYYRPLLAGKLLPLDTEFLIVAPEGITYPMPWQIALGSNVLGPAMWVGETGVDEVTLGVDRPLVNPIPAYITSGNIGMTAGGPDQSLETVTNKIVIDKIEPDIQGSGQNYIKIQARDFPLSKEYHLLTWQYNMDQDVEYIPFDLQQVSQVAPNVQGRIMSVTFGCMGIQSTFYYGKCIITARAGATRP